MLVQSFQRNGQIIWRETLRDLHDAAAVWARLLFHDVKPRLQTVAKRGARRVPRRLSSAGSGGCEATRALVCRRRHNFETEFCRSLLATAGGVDHAQSGMDRKRDSELWSK